MALQPGSALKYGIAVGIGIAVGALGITLLTSNKKSFRSLASEAISRGLNAKEKALALAEGAKEVVSDLLAEAKQKNQDQEQSEG
jgi:hypothetical protein